MLHTIAIDDEPQALRVISHLAERVPFLRLEATFTDALEALAYLPQHPVDLVLLDIKMPDITGLDWLRGLDRPPLVIFTTAYSEYAAESYELEAVDYLVKPIAFNRFLKAVNRAARLRESQRASYAFVKSGHEYHRVDFEQLCYVQSATNYVDFHLEAQRITVRMTLGEALELLPAHFIQVHRSYVVNLRRVDQVVNNHVVMGEVRIPISQGHREALLKRLG